MKEGKIEKTEDKEELRKKLQKKFEAHLAGGYIADNQSVEPKIAEAKEKGIELTLAEGMRDVLEESYVRVVHNPEAGHADHARKSLLEWAKEKKGIDIDYGKVVKMEFRDFLKIPKERWLDEEKEVEVDDRSMKIEMHGFFKEDEDKTAGKYIMAKDSETDEQRIIFDSTMGEHKDIGAKYDVKPIGGGWMTINPKEKKIIITKESEDFGTEPREKTIKALKEMYPDWDIDTEPYYKYLCEGGTTIDFKEKTIEAERPWGFDKEERERRIQQIKEMYPDWEVKEKKEEK